MPILVEQNPPRGRWFGVVVMAALIALGYVVARPTTRPELPAVPATADDSRSFIEAAEPAPPEPPAEADVARR